MRAFFAFKPEPEICLQIEAWRQLNWPLLERAVPAANFHTTLVFLGDITAPQLEALIGTVDSMSAAGFDVPLDTTGYWSKTGILWLGPAATPPSLAELARALRSATRSCRVPIEQRAYQPHLTLARRLLPAPVAPITPASFSCHCDSFALYESINTGAGVRYDAVAQWRLGNQ